jgi:hypothetical protein
MYLDTLRTQKFKTGIFSAKISDGLFFMLIAGYVIAKVSLHILQRKCFLH